MAVPHCEAWLHSVAPRLQASGFAPLNPQTYQPRGFLYAVHRCRLELTKFGMAEAYFVFAQIETLTPDVLNHFSWMAYTYSIANKSFPLPCGFFESVWCFPVAITYQLHPQMADYVRSMPLRKHWAAGEFPVVFDTATGQLCFCERTPLWGAAYYAGFREEVRRNLG